MGLWLKQPDQAGTCCDCIPAAGDPPVAPDPCTGCFPRCGDETEYSGLLRPKREETGEWFEPIDVGDYCFWFGDDGSYLSYYGSSYADSLCGVDFTVPAGWYYQKIQPDGVDCGAAYSNSDWAIKAQVSLTVSDPIDGEYLTAIPWPLIQYQWCGSPCRLNVSTAVDVTIVLEVPPP